MVGVFTECRKMKLRFYHKVTYSLMICVYAPLAESLTALKSTNEPCHVKNQHFAYAKTKTQFRLAVTARLISPFVFVIQIVQFFYFP